MVYVNADVIVGENEKPKVRTSAGDENYIIIDCDKVRLWLHKSLAKNVHEDLKCILYDESESIAAWEKRAYAAEHEVERLKCRVEYLEQINAEIRGI